MVDAVWTLRRWVGREVAISSSRTRSTAPKRRLCLPSRRQPCERRCCLDDVSSSTAICSYGRREVGPQALCTAAGRGRAHAALGGDRPYLTRRRGMPGQPAQHDGKKTLACTVAPAPHVRAQHLHLPGSPFSSARSERLWSPIGTETEPPSRRADQVMTPSRRGREVSRTRLTGAEAVCHSARRARSPRGLPTAAAPARDQTTASK